MGSIYCRCGHRMSDIDVEEASRRSAAFLPESLLNRVDEPVQTRLLALLEAVRQGQTAAQFMGWQEPQSPSEVSSQHTLLSWHLFGEPTADFSRQMLQCDACGRLLVELGKTKHYTSFLPEDPDKARHILSADDWWRADGASQPPAVD